MPKRKRPPSRAAIRRSSENDPRNLLEPAPSAAAIGALAGRASFDSYSKHKKNPSAYGLKAWEGQQEDRTFCDEHAGFEKADMARAPGLLRRGIQAGLWGDGSNKGDPNRLWTVDDNGWIYEAQVTNPGYALYHAYPVLPNEAIARKVLRRYEVFVANSLDATLNDSLREALRRYR